MTSIKTRKFHFNRKWLNLKFSGRRETDIMGQFLGTKTYRICQFLGPETG
jgi:hypothetical protein